MKSLAEWAFEGNPKSQQELTETITVIIMAYMFVYERADNELYSFVKLSGTADFIRLKYKNTWDFFYAF